MCASASYSTFGAGKVDPVVCWSQVLFVGARGQYGAYSIPCQPKNCSFFLARSVFHLECRTLLGPALPAVIQPRGGNVGMPEPLLHLGNIGVVRQGIGRRGGTQGMHAKSVYIGIDAHHRTVALYNALVHRIRMQVLREYLGDVVLHRPKERTIEILLVLGLFQILGDESLCFQAHRDVAHLTAITCNPSTMSPPPQS